MRIIHLLLRIIGRKLAQLQNLLIHTQGPRGPLSHDLCNRPHIALIRGLPCGIVNIGKKNPHSSWLGWPQSSYVYFLHSDIVAVC